MKAFGITLDKYFFDLNDKGTFISQYKKILKKPVDGVLYAPSFVEDAKVFATECEKRKIPYVFINSDIPDQNNLCYIGPELFSSGYASGHLINYIISEGEKALILNISKTTASLYHLEQKEEGFRSFFEKEGKKIQVEKLEIRNTDYNSIKKELDVVLKNNSTRVIFVTNSRVFYVAKYLVEKNIKNIALVGYDFIEKNLNYLNQGVIDFLICQKPKAQGYRGVMTLYNKLVRNEEVKKTHYMSIDIITKENYKFYKN